VNNGFQSQAPAENDRTSHSVGIMQHFEPRFVAKHVDKRLIQSRGHIWLAAVAENDE